MDNSQRSVLLVEDELAIRRGLRATLSAFHFLVGEASSGEEALLALRQASYDAVLLDLNMSGMGGIEACRRIRKEFPDISILIVTVRNAERDKIEALDAGADDYITKPFSSGELLARLRAHLRRRVAGAPVSTRIVEGDFVIDIEAHRVLVRGQELHLTPKEFELLVLLIKSPGRVLTQRILLREIWGSRGEGQSDYVRILVAQLRKKIDLPGQTSYIETEPWIGYRLRAGDTTE